MWDLLVSMVPGFTFGYPFVMAWYWMTGGILHRLVRAWHEPEARRAAAARVVPARQHPRAVPQRGRERPRGVRGARRGGLSGFRDDRDQRWLPRRDRAILDELAGKYERLRVVHLATNRGKALALDAGAIAARHEILVAIDGDSLLDRDAVTWFVRRFLSDGTLGALTGNPRIRNRPKALCWILMPETLGGLWRQRLRWSEGGTQTVLRLTPQMFHRRLWRLWLVWFNYLLSVLWAYAMLAGLVAWCLRWTPLATLVHYPAFSPVPQGWGALLTATYLVQASVSLLLDHRFEQGILRVIFWQPWYPLFFWVLQALTAVAGVPRAILRLMQTSTGTWISPDRGVR
jgi:hypothetical protein